MEKESIIAKINNELLLTKRESEIVYYLVCQEKVQKEIAETLFISPQTVLTHRKNIYRKVGVHSGNQLQIKVMEHPNLQDLFEQDNTIDTLSDANLRLLYKKINNISDKNDDINSISDDQKTNMIYNISIKTFLEITNRQREIMGLISKGMTASQIGKTLYISDETVSAHKHNISKKLGFNSQQKLTRWYILVSTTLEKNLEKRELIENKVLVT